MPHSEILHIDDKKIVLTRCLRWPRLAWQVPFYLMFVGLPLYATADSFMTNPAFIIDWYHEDATGLGTGIALFVFFAGVGSLGLWRIGLRLLRGTSQVTLSTDGTILNVSEGMFTDTFLLPEIKRLYIYERKASAVTMERILRAEYARGRTTTILDLDTMDGNISNAGAGVVGEWLRKREPGIEVEREYKAAQP